ncbi:MAG: hypothetical protein O2968_20785 [Acidobacteria bacterium]|nr:hypothetical protein [Acidobacteriota bacterium]
MSPVRVPSFLRVEQPLLEMLRCRRLQTLSILIVVVLSTAKVRGADFRNADFGMSKEQVKATEQAEPDVETETELVYRDVEVAGLSADAKYFFSADWFRSGHYQFHPFQMVQHYSEAFNRLSAWITEKYGKPSNEVYVQPSGEKVHSRGSTILV